MKFMEQLDKAAKNGINIGDLVIANEVACLTPLKGEEFEKACWCAERAYLKDDARYNVSEIVKTTYYLFKIAEKEGTPFNCGPRDILRLMDEGVAWYDSASVDEIYGPEEDL